MFLNVKALEDVMKKSVMVLLVATVTAISLVSLGRDNVVGAQAVNVPVGVIVSWPGPKNTIPNDWLECDGRELSRTQFRALFNAIGTTWGGTATTSFKIPELRGYFLRGVDDGAGRDPDVNGRRPFGNGPTNSSGSVQAFQVQNHSHKTEGYHLEADGGNGFDGAGFASNSSQNHPMRGQYPTLTDGGGSETRPVNAYVYWIIKAR